MVTSVVPLASASMASTHAWLVSMDDSPERPSRAVEVVGHPPEDPVEVGHPPISGESQRSAEFLHACFVLLVVVLWCAYGMIEPPLTWNVWPVIHSAASESRKQMAFA